MIQWLGYGTFTAKGADSIPGQGTKIRKPWGAAQTKQNKNTKQMNKQKTAIIPNHKV